MTRRHDERWAVPIGPDEYVGHLEEEFFRLRQVERTLDANIDFMRSERDRLMDAGDQARVQIERLRSERDHNELRGLEYKAEVERLRGDLEDVLAQLQRLQIPARHLSDQWEQREGFDQDDWDALREALPTWHLAAAPEAPEEAGPDDPGAFAHEIERLRAENERLQTQNTALEGVYSASLERAERLRAEVDRQRQHLGRIADPEVYDLDARAMRREAEEALA